MSFDEGVVQPCVGCGYCCQKTVCFVGQANGAHHKPPCEFLVHKDGRFWCLLVLQFEDSARMKHDLAIGCGCSSSMFNTQRDAQLKRMQK
jgi:hypothetical protein